MEKYWSPDEIAILRQRYCLTSISEMQALLPHRTWVAIRHKAQRLELWRPLKTAAPHSNLSVADLAYFAGFFDGEGSVILHKQHSSTPQRQTYSLCVSLANTHLPTLQWVKELWGIGTITSMGKGKKNWQPVWELWLHLFLSYFVKGVPQLPFRHSLQSFYRCRCAFPILLSVLDI